MYLEFFKNNIIRKIHLKGVNIFNGLITFKAKERHRSRDFEIC